MNMHLLISLNKNRFSIPQNELNNEMHIQNMMQTCNNWMLININILYVFNPILLTNVFAADLQWSNSTILISKNDFRQKNIEKYFKENKE